nr:FecR domain-containing protein [Pedobacter panaciterrae]
MIDRSLFNVEDFLVDNTFQLYCAGTDKLCITYWENYIKAHPEQETVIAEAKRLYVILSGNKKPLNKQVDLLKNSIEPQSEVNIIPVRKNYMWLKIAAAILVIVGIGVIYKNNLKEPLPNASLITHFSTKGGEKKKITLPDGSMVLLNARSVLTVDKNFNDKNREVNLVGEAFFDVTHNKNRPFKVHTEDFDINVLGTSFNVKIYPGEATSETVLIKGLIVMEGKGTKGSSITLRPSQKVTFYKKVEELPSNIKSQKPSAVHPQIAINQYTKVNDSTIVEMAWTQNRLEILDQTFAEVKGDLERWFNVEIIFKDHEVEKYHFTATFRHENIEQALKAFQDAEHFKYEIKGNQVTISK